MIEYGSFEQPFTLSSSKGRVCGAEASTSSARTEYNKLGLDEQYCDLIGYVTQISVVRTKPGMTKKRLSEASNQSGNTVAQKLRGLGVAPYVKSEAM
jgi:hypothetical protein